VNERLYLGVEIGGTKLQVVLGNDHAAIIDRRRYAVERKAGGAGIRRQIGHALADYSRNHRITAVGIGFGGPVDWRTGKICCSHHIEGWSDFDIGGWMEEMARVPVRVDNDANTAALAEALRGAGQGFQRLFYVTLGSGVGGGFVSDGQIWHGAIPGEAEIGHVRLDKQGTIVESRCSGWAVDQRIRKAIAQKPGSQLEQLIGGTQGNEAKHLRKAIENGDALAKAILEETAEDLAFALSHVTHLMHPEVIVLGGGLSLSGDILRAAVQKHLERFIMDAFRPGPPVKIAGLAEDVVPVGALLLAKTAAG
jgi:glucokinase